MVHKWVWFVQCPLSEVCLQNELFIKYTARGTAAKAIMVFSPSIHFCTRAPGRGDGGVRNTRWYMLLLQVCFLHCLLCSVLCIPLLLLLTTARSLRSMKRGPSHAWPVSFGSAGCGGGQMFHAGIVPLLCTPAFRARNATLHIVKYWTEYDGLWSNTSTYIHIRVWLFSFVTIWGRWTRSPSSVPSTDFRCREFILDIYTECILDRDYNHLYRIECKLLQSM